MKKFLTQFPNKKSFFVVSSEVKMELAKLPQIEENDSAGEGVVNSKVQRSFAGVLPLFKIKSLLFGSSMVSLPFAPYGGILADNEDVEEALFQRAAGLTKEKDLHYMEIRNENNQLRDLQMKNLYFGFVT